MSTENKQWTYKVEDIFQDIPDDLENVNMTLPPEVCEEAGFQPGDKIRILWGDQGTIIINKVEEESNGEG